MDDYYTACDAVVIPYRRGFATTSTHLRRASENGLAILACDQYLIGEIVRKYDLGLLFPPEDVSAMSQCLRDFSLKPKAWFDEIHSRSKTIVDEQSWAVIGRQYRKLFERVISR